MKKYMKIIITFIIIVGISSLFLILNKLYNKTNFEINISEVQGKSSDLKYKLICKGLKGARDFTIDEEGNYYIAYKDKIQYLQKDGKSYDVINDKKFDINSIECKNGLYFTSLNSVFYYDIHNKVLKEIINDLPNFGDYNLSLIKVYKDSLYVSVGSATNSGVVGEDNIWLKDKTYNCDIMPFDITIQGKNFQNGKTGAFVPYKTKNISGQIIPGHFPGNASIVRYNLVDGNSESFAWGIRNIKGMDFNSDGKLFASVGGMEDRGLRPVKGDLDYIFEVKKDNWYGWPDYSGGDPISSPKFKGKGNERISFILDKHPSINPPSPLYQHKLLNSLQAVCIDSSGILGEKDDIYFYDVKENSIGKLNKKGFVKPVLGFSKNSTIKSVKFGESGIIVLDSKQGCLYDFHTKLYEPVYIDKNIYYCLFAVVLVIIMGIIKIKG